MPFPVGYFISCIVFLVGPLLPPSLYVLSDLLCELGDDFVEDIGSWLWFVICVMLNPVVAILITGSRVFIGDQNELEKKIEDGWLEMDMDVVTGFKMFEIIGK